MSQFYSNSFYRTEPFGSKVKTGEKVVVVVYFFLSLRGVKSFYLYKNINTSTVCYPFMALKVGIMYKNIQ